MHAESVLPIADGGPNVADLGSFVVANVGDSRRLRRLRHRPGQRIAVRIATAAMDGRRRERLERQINRDLNACGCNAGATFGLICLLGAALHGASNGMGWLAWIGGFFASILAGKAFGILAARVRLAQALDEVERSLPKEA